MPKVDFSAMRRLHGVRETKTFNDSHWPGQPVTVTLESKPGTATQLSIQAYAQQLQDRFLAPGAMGVFIGDPEDRIEARITPEICQVIATVQIHDVTPVADKYDFEDYVKMAELMPDAFAELVVWAQSMIGQTAQGEIPNDSAAATVESLPPPAISTSGPILRWSQDGTPLTAASCEGSGSSAAPSSTSSDKAAA
jgi:hypothetical protein